MKCKICEKPFTTFSVQTGHFSVIPNCLCGKTRRRVREQGCPNCKSNMIDLMVMDNGYNAICRDCEEWWLTND